MNPQDTLREALACVGLCAIVFCLLVRCSEAQEMTARDMVLNEARAASMAGPHDDIRCYQVRDYGRTRVCISEAMWRLQHAGDRNGTKTEASIPAVAGAD